MSKTMKRRLAGLLVWLQILALLVVAAPRTQAAAVQPVRNPVIEGTLRFGSFGFNLTDRISGIKIIVPNMQTLVQEIPGLSVLALVPIQKDQIIPVLVLAQHPIYSFGHIVLCCNGHYNFPLHDPPHSFLKNPLIPRF